MNEVYKNGNLHKNIEFKSTAAGKYGQKKCELDFVTNEHIGEIKYHSAFQPKEVIVKLDKVRQVMSEDFEFIGADKYIIIDAFNCNIHYHG